MKKILIVLSLSLLIPTAVCWSVCCTSITAGPTAWAPEFNKVGCSRSAKVSFGGTATVRCGNENLYQTTVTQATKLYVVVAGMGDALAASTAVGRDVNCNTETVVASWTPTAGCAVLTGQSCYSQYTIKTTACATSPAQTVTVNSSTATCP